MSCGVNSHSLRLTSSWGNLKVQFHCYIISKPIILYIMKSILITGCNRGIGLGMVKYLAEYNKSPKNIFATCRNPEEATKLQDIARKHSNIKILQFDLKNFISYEKLAAQVSDVVKDEGLNVLFNNAGVTTKFTRVNLVKLEQMIENLTINTVAPLMLTKSFLPLLKQASTTNSSAPIGVSRAAIINVSSVLGSIASNNQGGFYPYRASKTALNAISRSLSFDLKEDKILVMSLHPGWIKTDMGGSKAPLEVEAAVKSIINTLENLTDKHNGGFYQYDGTQLPW